MTANEQIIHHFFSAFQKKEVKTMQDSYAENAIFNDAVFGTLDATQVKAMWQMLLARSGDINITFNNIKEFGEGKVLANWEASYVFSSTGNKVVNKVKAEFTIAAGKITQHNDRFDFYKWAKQAFGGGGFLLGWTNFFQQRVRLTAKQKLEKYMQKISRQ